ncbi:SBBP repeat-containing protein, partial [Chloroflexota bacterium]
MKAHFNIYWKTGLMAMLTLLALVLATGPGQSSFLAQAQISQPLMFIENVGQFDSSTRFQANGSLTTLSLTEDALWFTIIEDLPTEHSDVARMNGQQVTDSRQGVNLKLSFVNANPHPKIEPFNRLDTRISFFTGSDPAHWQADVPVWGGVRYVDLYPGFDLEISSENGQLVPRLMPQDKATTAANNQAQNAVSLPDISLQIEGAETLAVDDMGYLRLTTAVGEFTLPLLQVEQADLPIPASTLTPGVEGNIVSRPFATASQYASPQAHIAGASDLLYSTFLGRTGNLDTGRDIAIDPTGHAYVTGQAYNDFPTTPGAFDTSIDGVFSDAFVAKLNPDGSDLVYATFLGGSDYDTATSIVIDEAGNAYLAGYTTSTDFSTSPGAFDSELSGESDTFAAKFNATGTELLYATLLGGNDNEFSWGIDVDDTGNAYVTGFTPSFDFPTTPGAFDTEIDNWYDVFVVKLNTDASDLVYGTFVGGNNADYSFGGVAVDSNGSAYVTGYTHSTDFPVTSGAFDTTYDDQEIFVFKLNPTGSDLDYATYLGGTKSEYAEDIVVDEAGNVYLTGTTRSIDFPVTTGAFDTDYNSEVEEYEGDSFVAKLNASGSDVLYGTYLGGNGDEVGQAITLDTSGNIYIAGETSSANFPTTSNAFDTVFEGEAEMFPPPDVFIVRLNSSGDTLTYATYLGTGTGYDQAYGIDVDEAGNAYITGVTSSADF